MSDCVRLPLQQDSDLGQWRLVCREHGYVTSLKMGPLRDESADEAWAEHSRGQESAATEKTEARRRQREQVTALIASAARALDIALIEAQALRGADHDMVRSLDCAVRLAGVAKRWNEED